MKVTKTKRILSFVTVLCMLVSMAITFSVVSAEDVSVAEVEWEETYYYSPVKYYAGGAAGISVEDNSFDDWAGRPVVETDSILHPENWQTTPSGELIFRYALAWDATNLYFYIEWDAPMAKLNVGSGLAATRLFYDVNPTAESGARTGLIDFQYDEDSDKMVVFRADKGRAGGNKTDFQAAISLYAEENDGVTTLEAAIPWAAMDDPFTPEDNAEILYSVCAYTTDTKAYLYAQDTTPFKNAGGSLVDAPWQNNNKFATMYFSDYETDDYYAGKAADISVEDNSFDDWAGQPVVEIDSTLNPENWQTTPSGELVFRYALAWDATNLYFFIEWDVPMAKLNVGAGLGATRLFYDVNPEGGGAKRTGLIDLQYNADDDKMVVFRADNRRVGGNNEDFQAAISLYAEENGGVTTLEAAIPWAAMGDPFVAYEGAEILYSVCAYTTDTKAYLYAQDTAPFKKEGGAWGDAPWVNNNNYLTMHLNEYAPMGEIMTPTALGTSEVPPAGIDNAKTNMARGKTYTGTLGTRGGWIDGGTLLTDGNFGTFESVGGGTFAGWQGPGADYLFDVDAEPNGRIVKIIDLGEVVEGLYEFVASSGQVAGYKIYFPSAVTFYASDNGAHYQLIGQGVVADYVSGTHGGMEKETQNFKVELETGIAARYIKVVIDPPTGEQDNYVITTVGQVAAYANVPVPGGDVPIGLANAYWVPANLADLGYAAGDLSVILTKPGTVADNLPGYASWFNWWTLGVFGWDEDAKAHRLLSKHGEADGSGVAKGELVIPENGFALATHGGMDKHNDGNKTFKDMEVGGLAQLYGDAVIGIDIADFGNGHDVYDKLTLSISRSVDRFYNPLAPKYEGNALEVSAAFSGENVAKSKSYTTGFTATDPAAAVGGGGTNHMDTDPPTKLTDGVAANSYGKMVSWLRVETGWLTVDLEESTELAGLRLAYGRTNDGVEAPGYVKVSVSDDNENWTYLGEMDGANVNTNGLHWATLALPKAVTARYVKYEFNRVHPGVFLMISEVEAYNTFLAPTKIDIDFVSKWAVGSSIITSTTVGADMTLMEIMGKDYHYWKLAVVDWDNTLGDYVVTKKYNTFEDHSDVVVPSTGFVLGVHSADAEEKMALFTDLAVGNKVFLYNVDPLTAGKGEDLTDAFFTFPVASAEEGDVPVRPIPIASGKINNVNKYAGDVVTLITRIEGHPEATTIGELSAIFYGASKDFNYFVLAVADWNVANGRYEVISTHTALQTAPGGNKTDVVIPETGFAIGYHGNVSISVFNDVEVGDPVFLYIDGEDLGKFKAGTAAADLQDTYYSIGKRLIDKGAWYDPAAGFDPIVSLGAKVNAESKGIRFGSKYIRNAYVDSVAGLGMLLYPTELLGEDTLDLAYWADNPYDKDANDGGVHNIREIGVVGDDFVTGQAFEKYAEFTFYVTLNELPDDDLDTEITAVPYVRYADGTVFYGEALVRSYNGVLDAAAE